MGRPPKWTPQQKLSMVLAVLRQEGALAEIARRHQVSGTSLAKWRDAFLTGGLAALSAGGPAGPTGREQALESEVEDLKAALGEAQVELRVWRKGGRCTRLRGPRRDPRRRGHARRGVLRPAGDPAGDLVPVEGRRRRRRPGKGPWPTPAQDAVETAVK